MKATRANLLGEFTGRLDGLIYYRSRITGKLYVRRQWQCEMHPAYPAFKSANQAIFALQPSTGYKRDIKDYIMQYNALPEGRCKPLISWTNIYAMLMFAMQKTMPEQVELKTISRQQITEQNLPCITLKDAVDAGLLPVVRNYERFTHQL